MKKLLLSGLMVCVMAMPALAGLNYPNIDVKGDLSLKAISADNYYDNTTGAVQAKVDTAQLTADLKLSAELVDNVSLKAVLRNASTQGNGDNVDLNDMLLSTSLLNCHIDVKDIAGKGVDAVIGRQEIGSKGNSLVVYNEAADGTKLSRKCGPVEVTYALVNGPAAKDTLNAIMLAGKIGQVNASLADYVQEMGVAMGTNKILDLAVSGKIPVACGIDASLEYAMQSGCKVGTGKEKDATAMLVKIGCGGCDMAVGKASCGLTILNTSGAADKEYTGIAPSLKLTEIASDIAAAGATNDDLTYNTAITNLNATVINLGLAPSAVAGLNLGFAYGTYKLNEKNSSGETKLATEINLTAGYKASDAISLNLLLAQLTPGKALTPGTDKATKIQAGMKIAF